MSKYAEQVVAQMYLEDWVKKAKYVREEAGDDTIAVLAMLIALRDSVIGLQSEDDE